MNAAARTYVECMKIIGWTVIVAALMYLMMIRSNPDGVQYGTPEWCPAGSQVCEDWGQGVLR